jgi:hypothetical protein
MEPSLNAIGIRLPANRLIAVLKTDWSLHRATTMANFPRNPAPRHIRCQ